MNTSTRLTLKRLEGRFTASDARRQWASRESLLVELEEDGLVGRGEAAPLPGYSRETLDECAAALREGGTLPPAAAFARASARAEIRAQRERTNLCPPGGRALATLGDAPGYAAYKRKLGRDLDGELEAARQLRDAHPHERLRFDANGTLSVSDARRALKALARIDAELFEEPVPYESLAALHPSPVPLALDESLQAEGGEARLREALDAGWIGAVVLKPSALGPDACRRFARMAREAGAEVIVSHLYEGPLGYAAACALALEIGTDVPQGLGRHDALEAFEGWRTDLGRDGLRGWEGSRYPVTGP